MKNLPIGLDDNDLLDGFRTLCLRATALGSWATVLFAAILLTGCSSNPPGERTSTVASSQSDASTDPSAAKNVESVHEVAVKIDTMMCVEGCFNGIKTVLEKRPGIEEVRLAPQKEEGTIDNSMIYIKHRGELDKAEMERLILGAGFDKMEFVK